MRVCVCVCAYVRIYVRVRVCVYMRAYVRVCVLVSPSRITVPVKRGRLAVLGRSSSDVSEPRRRLPSVRRTPMTGGAVTVTVTGVATVAVTGAVTVADTGAVTGAVTCTVAVTGAVRVAVRGAVTLASTDWEGASSSHVKTSLLAVCVLAVCVFVLAECVLAVCVFVLAACVCVLAGRILGSAPSRLRVSSHAAILIRGEALTTSGREKTGAESSDDVSITGAESADDVSITGAESADEVSRATGEMARIGLRSSQTSKGSFAPCACVWGAGNPKSVSNVSASSGEARCVWSRS